eukprot:scaffold31369_cov48-Tisochrysis_lutea.AAC.3
MGECPDFIFEYAGGRRAREANMDRLAATSTLCLQPDMPSYNRLRAFSCVGASSNSDEMSAKACWMTRPKRAASLVAHDRSVEIIIEMYSLPMS